MSDLIDCLRDGDLQKVLGDESIAALCASAADRIEKLETALREIIAPIAAMQIKAAADGSVLDGAMAVYLSDDPAYLRGIAREALKS